MTGGNRAAWRQARPEIGIGAVAVARPRQLVTPRRSGGAAVAMAAGVISLLVLRSLVPRHRRGLEDVSGPDPPCPRRCCRPSPPVAARSRPADAQASMTAYEAGLRGPVGTPAGLAARRADGADLHDDPAAARRALPPAALVMTACGPGRPGLAPPGRPVRSRASCT